MSFGKHYVSMYEGSMRGKGSPFFAVWGYIISHMRPSQAHGAIVELNPEIIGFLIGEDAGVVAAKVAEMCEPDPRSRTTTEGGRKLVKIGEYSYRVVNGAHYRALRNEDERREYQRIKQTEYRMKRRKAPPSGRENRYCAATTQEERDKIAAEGLPAVLPADHRADNGRAPASPPAPAADDPLPPMPPKRAEFDGY